MALVKCPECKASISDTAKSCPKCGYENLQEKIEAGEVEKPMSGEKKTGCGCLIAILVVVAILFGMFMVVGLSENIKRESYIHGK